MGFVEVGTASVNVALVVSPRLLAGVRPIDKGAITSTRSASSLWTSPSNWRTDMEDMIVVTGTSLTSFAEAAKSAFDEIPGDPDREGIASAVVERMWMTKGGFVGMQYHVKIKGGPFLADATDTSAAATA